jgi:hypothetical protein
MNTQEQLPLIKKLESFDMADFFSKNKSLVIIEVINLFLKQVEETRGHTTALFLENQNKEMLKKFVQSIKNNIERICLYYVYTFPYVFIPNQEIDADLPQDEILLKISQIDLSENEILREAVERFIAWLLEDEVFKQNLDCLCIAPVALTKMRKSQKTLNINMEEFFKDPNKKQTRKRKFDELKEELKEELKKSTVSFDECVKKATQFRLNNPELNQGQISLFVEWITNITDYIYNQKTIIYSEKLSSPYSVGSTSVSQRNLVPNLSQKQNLVSLETHNNNQDYFFHPTRMPPVDAGLMEKVESLEAPISLEDFQLSLEKARLSEVKTPAPRKKFEAPNGQEYYSPKNNIEDYQLSEKGLKITLKRNPNTNNAFHKSQPQNIVEMTDHNKIVAFFISKDISPGAAYRNANLNWNELVSEYKINLAQFPELDEEGTIIKSSAKYRKTQ